MQKKDILDFPGGPVVKTMCSQCRGHEFDSWLGKILHAAWRGQKKEKAIKKKLFIYFWLCWVFVSVRGLSLVVASGGHPSSRCMGLSLSWPLLLWSTDSRRAGSVVVAHGPSCSAACGILPDQGSNSCPLHRQADSQQLRHQGSPEKAILRSKIISVKIP